MVKRSKVLKKNHNTIHLSYFFMIFFCTIILRFKYYNVTNYFNDLYIINFRKLVFNQNYNVSNISIKRNDIYIHHQKIMRYIWFCHFVILYIDRKLERIRVKVFICNFYIFYRLVLRLFELNFYFLYNLWMKMILRFATNCRSSDLLT